MSIQQLTTLLQNKQEELTRRISAIEADFHKGRSQDFAEQATETENDEVLDGIHVEAKIELAQVKAALQRIDDKLYGNCTECNETIAPARLTALPYATTCLDCAI